MQSSYIPRARSLAVALVLVLLGIVFFAGSAHAQAPNLTEHFAWDPDGIDWVQNNIDGYTEGDVVPFYVGGTGQGTISMCFEYVKAGKYGFIGIEEWDTDYTPSEDPSGAGLPPFTTPVDDPQGGPVGAVSADITSVTSGIGDGTPCGTNELELSITFLDTGDPGWYFVYGGHLAAPGDPLPTVPVTYVPENSGAGTMGGNTYARVAVGGGQQRILFATGNIARATANLHVVKSCPQDFTVSNGKLLLTYDIQVTNLGNTGAPNTTDYASVPAQLVKVTDDLHDFLDLVSASWTLVDGDGNTIDPTGSCSPPAPASGGPLVTCELGTTDLPLASPLDLTGFPKWVITIVVEDKSTSKISFNNVAEVTAATYDPVLTNNTDDCSATTPVTLSSFEATGSDGEVRFAWSTATEFGNGGFNLYVEAAQGRAKLNDQLIPSQVVNSTAPQVYSYSAAVAEGTLFYIEDVSVWGERTLHGPYALGESYGSVPVAEPIDWAAIRAEHEVKEAARLAEGGANTALSPAAIEFPVVSQAFLPLVAIAGNADSAAGPDLQLQIKLDRTGLYRVTYEQLVAAGFDLRGARAADLALSNKGIAVAIRVGGPAVFGPGSFIEFYGEAHDSLYTHTNVYLLQTKGGMPLRVQVDATAPNMGQPAAAFYMHTTTIENNAEYNTFAPTGDPWISQKLIAMAGTPGSWTYSIPADNYVAGVADSKVQVDVWGVSNLIPGLDHRITARVNGTVVADEYFDGVAAHFVEATVPAALVTAGTNALQLTLPAAQGAEFDMVMLNAYGLTYPRAFVAQDGRLTFTAAGERFKVSGLPSGNVVVYRLDASGPVLMSNVQVSQAGATYEASFAGKPSAATYVVYAEPALLKPVAAALRAKTDITTGKADYVMISHPDFKNGLGALVAARKAQGLTVRVVDVFDVYNEFSYGIVDPNAIRDYIAHAANNMGTKYVLLVGGDTYDYFNYLKSNSISFVPTLYAATDDYLPFAPVDPLMADVDRDNVPDVALGRLPVRTSAELSTVIAKTLKYEQATGYGGTAVFAADLNFSGDSDAIIAELPATWTIHRAYLDTQTVAGEASANLVSRMNEGVALTSYVGHSGPTKWSSKNLFSSDGVAGLTNSERPTIVVQWGCWNTYHVEPSYSTLGHKFILADSKGAAAVMGASAMGYSHTQAQLGQAVAARLAQPGMTIGNAVLQAKQELAAGGADMRDVILGWTIQGDPALRMKAQ